MEQNSFCNANRSLFNRWISNCLSYIRVCFLSSSTSSSFCFSRSFFHKSICLHLIAYRLPYRFRSATIER